MIYYLKFNVCLACTIMLETTAQKGGIRDHQTQVIVSIDKLKKKLLLVVVLLFQLY